MTKFAASAISFGSKSGLFSRLALAAVATGALAVQAMAADAATDFSVASNPNGAWSYGWATSLGGVMNLDTQNLPANGPIGGWGGFFATDGNPAVSKNFSGSLYSYLTLNYLPNQMIMHPGPNNEYSIVRYTAPTTSMYAISADFIGQDYIFPTSTDVHLVVNGSSVWDDVVNSYGITTGTSTALSLQAGDTIDLQVGPGDNFNYFGDSTGANLTVTATPEPCSVAAIGFGLIGLLRRRKS